MTKRIAVVVSHPIQHFCPQYSSWSRLSGIHLKVFFASRHGIDPYVDKNFGMTVQWKGLTLDFPHEFLAGASDRTPDSSMDCAELDASLDAFSPDAVVVYGYIQPLQRRAMRWAKRRKRRLLMIADSELRARRGIFKSLVKKMLLPRILKHVDAFLTVGDANEQYYRHYGVDDRRLVRCFFPIDVMAFDRALERREAIRLDLRASIGIPPNQLVILCVGKLVSWKRQIDLVHLSNLFQSLGRDATIILAGTGPDEAVLRSAASRIGVGGVLFAGFVSPELLINYYIAADVYVHCSEIEPHSLAISEAIYSSMPVVLSDRCGSYGPSDDVRPGLNGFFYPCGDVRRLADAVVHSATVKESMAGKSRAIAVANQALAHGKALQQAMSLIDFGSK